MPGSNMTLPEVPPGPSRHLLQVVWNIASETGHWPTFAELDRRLDSPYDIQALDVLRVMPEGFLYGVGPNSPMPLADSHEIGLTVAGLAGCQNTSEILSVFIEFIQMATRLEKGWQPPPGQPDAQASLTDIEFASRARALPAAGRGRILQLLLLVIRTERNGWAGYAADPGTGHWTISFSREIRAFRNVHDIDDYWSCRFKPWETRHAAPAPVTPVITYPGAAKVSYIFNAPVSGTNVAVGDNAIQHVDDPDMRGPGRPSESNGDAVRAARIGGRYAIAAAVLAAIIGAIVTAAFTNGFGLISSDSSSSGLTPAATVQVQSTVGREFHIDNTFDITVLNISKCSGGICVVDIRFRNVSGYTAAIGPGSFVSPEDLAGTRLCNPFPTADCISDPVDGETFYYVISVVGNGNHYDSSNYPAFSKIGQLLPRQAVQVGFTFAVPPQTRVEELQLNGISGDSVVRFSNP
jgi:hypothetical protein